MGVVTKRVNIDAKFPVRSISPVIHGVKKDTIMTSSDILKCLCRRARVEEILPNGTTVLLNMNNYYTDNGAGLDAEHIVVKEDNHNVTPPAIVDEQPPVHIEPPVEDTVIEDTHIENSATKETVVENIIEEESHEDVINEVPEAPIEAQVVETKTDDEVKCEVEAEETVEDGITEVEANDITEVETEETIEDGITEVEAEPVAASVNAENTHKKNNNNKKKK